MSLRADELLTPAELQARPTYILWPYLLTMAQLTMALPTYYGPTYLL